MGLFDGGLLPRKDPISGQDTGDIVFGTAPKLAIKSPPTLTKKQRGLNEAVIEQLLASLRDGSGVLGGPTGAESLSLQGLDAFTQDLLRGLGGGDSSSTIPTTRDTLTNIQTRDATDIDEFFRTGIEQPILESLDRTINEDIASRFSGQFFGGERERAEGRAREDAIDALARERARVALAAREQDTNAALAAAGLSPSIEASAIDTITRNLAAQGVPRDIQIQLLQAIFNELGIKEFENVAAGFPGKTGILQSFVGGFGSGLGGAAIAAGGCWIARAAYGEHDPRWRMFRWWLFHKAPTWLHEWYIARGPVIGRWLRTPGFGKNLIRSAVRGVMNVVIRYGNSCQYTA